MAGLVGSRVIGVGDKRSSEFVGRGVCRVPDGWKEGVIAVINQ